MSFCFISIYVNHSYVKFCEILAYVTHPLMFIVCAAEKALKKKQIGIKMAPHDSATDAVIDILFQNKSKRPPDGCTVAG